MSSTAQFFEDKTLLITGGTGFLGQPLIEKILWVAPEVRRIHVLIRPKRQFGGRILEAAERLQRELFESSVFDRLRSLYGDELPEFLSRKLVAVSGDISRDDLGLEPATLARLRDELDIVVNSAAVVSFDAPLDEALELNVFGARRVAEFAASCRSALLAHVSTAYVCGATDQDIPEELPRQVQPQNGDYFPPRRFCDVDRDIEHVRELIARVQEEAHSPEVEREFKQALLERFRRSKGTRNTRRREKIENLRRRWIKNRLVEEGMKWARQRGWNDTYTYTKAMGEQVVTRVRNGTPTVIIRPSVIESSLAEPSPGWLDGLRMADPLIAAIGKGRLRALPLNPEVTLDLVPVDMVVNVILASLPRIAKEEGFRVYQVATGDKNPIGLGELYELIYRYFRKNPMLDKSGSPIRVKRLKFPAPSTFRFQYRLRTVPLDTAARTLEKLSIFDATQKFKRRISATRAAHEKLYYYGEIYEPYLNLNCRFRVDRALELFRSLSNQDQRQFNFDVTRLNWRHYIQNVHIPGVKKYILKVEGAGTLEIDSLTLEGAQFPVTIPDLLTRSAEQYSEKTALQIRRNGTWERLTYRELEQQAHALGEAFLAMGLTKGDRVVLFSENQPEWGVTFLGAASVGLVVVPVDSQSWHREVWALAHFTEARAILASEKCFSRFPEPVVRENAESERPLLLLNVNRRCLPFSAAEDQDAAASTPSQQPLPEIPIEPDDPVSIIFTTGTAADPRGAIHTHRNFLTNLLGVQHYLAISGSDRMLSVLPLYHALEFTCGFLMPLFGGASVTYAHSLKPRVILETMRETGTTCMLGVPTLYSLIREDIERRILKTSRSALKSNLVERSKQISRTVERRFGKNIGKRLFSKIHQEFGGRIRVFVSGGSALGDELYDDFKAMGMPIYEGYGLTETAPVLTVNPFKRSRRGSAGKPLPGVELRLSNTDRHGVGEILVRSPSLMKGYYHNERATAAVIREDWFHTGDLGWVDEDGYLYFTGRTKDVIVTGAGKNVYPIDLEAIYQTLPEISEICVLGFKNGLTEDVHAVIVPAHEHLPEGGPAQQRKHVQQAVQRLARELPSYHRLQFIHIWNEPLPRFTSGKLRRQNIRSRLEEQLKRQRAAQGRDQTRQTKQESLEDQILDELSRLSGLGLDEIEPETHLYNELGLDSLLAIELLLYLEHRCGIILSDEKASKLQTVGELLQEIRARTRERDRPEPRSAARKPAIRSTLPYAERPKLDRWLMRLSFGSLKVLFKNYFDLSVSTQGRFPASGAFIIAANHCSHADTGAVISALSLVLGVKESQKLHVLGARDYFFDSPIKSWFFSTFLNVVPIERHEASLAGLRTVKSILSRGEPILIFPEGTRSRNGRMQEFKPGLGLIAWELDVPVLPTYIEGTFQVMPKGKLFPGHSPVRVVFGDPISMDVFRGNHQVLPKDDLYRRIAAEVREAIQELAAHNVEAA